MPTKYLADMQSFFEELGIFSKTYRECDDLSAIPSFTAVIFVPDKPVF